jgi:multidrug resistance efflux pump
MKKTIVIALIVGIAAGIAGRLALRSDAGPPPADATQANPTEMVSANGVVEGAHPEVNLRPEVTGILTTLHVHADDVVSQGQLLAELSNETQKAQVALAQAELGVAEQHLKKLEAGERVQVIAKARAEVKSKEEALRLADADWVRAQRSSQGISAGDLDGLRTKVNMAQTALSIARSDLSQLEEGSRQEDIGAARAERDVARAKLQVAQADLAKTRLTAPTAGRVLQVFAEPGELIAPAMSQPVLILADLSRHRVRAFVEELDVDRVRVGQSAIVTADGLPGRSFAGKVAVVVPRMGKRSAQSDAPNELKDMYYREVLIDLVAGDELPTNLRVQVRVQTRLPEAE